ncbi:MAG: tRNA epoxyqueuosine(34) reductase QueG, partial [Janthinobacterium lividum]
RGDLRRSVPWARSVLVCAVNYNAEAPRSIDPAAADAGWIARYAWSGRGSAEMAPGDVPGSDYHEELLPRLKLVADRLREHFGDACQTRAYVDTGPILERGYAARAGIGWIGRNTCVLNQQQGSWILLGVVITSLEPEPEAWPIPVVDRCGSCTRCVDACPTDALHGSGLAGGSRQMDASRCIAYLTIEKKGSIDPDLREGMGRQVFGCDICQDVCPWNGRAPVGRSGMLQPRSELVNPSLAWLAAMDGPEFNRRFRGSPLERTRRKRILRNVANAMGNSKDLQFQPQLEAWLKNEDPVLAEAAQWALDRLTGQLEPITEEQTDRLQSAFAGPLDQ